MKSPNSYFIPRLVILLLLAWPVSAQGQELRIAELGACQLEGGETLRPCSIAYRTMGSLNPQGDNAVLVPTWFTGTSEESAEFFATVVDTTSFYVVVVDALGNGVSTSPSNSPTQGGEAFPRISIGDMVATQYRLITEELGLASLFAVTGASMGGMQTFEWMVSHPGFFERAIPLIGSPKLGAYDIALWETELRILDLYDSCQCSDAAAILAGVGMLAASTPEAFHAQTNPSEVETSLEAAAQVTLDRPDGWIHDMASQLHAMIEHDVSRLHGGDMATAAKATEAQLLSVVVATDHVVTPWPAIEFADLAGGESIVLDNNGGHGGLFVPGAKYIGRVQPSSHETNERPEGLGDC